MEEPLDVNTPDLLVSPHYIYNGSMVFSDHNGGSGNGIVQLIVEMDLTALGVISLDGFSGITWEAAVSFTCVTSCSVEFPEKPEWDWIKMALT